MKHRKTAGIALAVVVTAALAGALAGKSIQSPAEVAARTAAPARSPILASAEMRPMTTDVVTRGTASFGSPQKLSLATTKLKSGPRVATGQIGFGTALLASTIGSLVGAILIYGFARLGGRRLVLRWSRLVGTKPASIERAERRFENHGAWVVLVGRMVPGVRSLVSLPAGLLPMPVGRFLALSALGTVGWNALLLGTGVALDAGWRQATGVVDGLSTLVLVVLALAALTGGVLLVRRRLAVR